MSEKLRIGMIGAGRIGKLHAANLVNRVPDAQVMAVPGGQGTGPQAGHSRLV